MSLARAAALAANGPDSFVYWGWFEDNGDEVWSRTVEHLQLTGIAVGVGFAISLVLAAVAIRFRRTYAPITWVTGIMYTIPSVALFGFLIPYTHLGYLSAEIGLVSYTLLILVRNIVAGVDGVPPAVKEAADGMGYRPWRRFVSVDLRLATPAIIAGLRIATVTTIGLVTVTFLVGLGGYGAFIASGLSRTYSTPVVVGAVLSFAMALVFDLALLGVERLATPWARRAAHR